MTSATAQRLPLFTVALLTSLYVSQGLPSGFLVHALPALLREHGVPLEYIGLIKLLAFPWVLKFLWAPWVDRYYLPLLGPKRTWILLMQSCLVAALIAISLFQPTQIFSQAWLPFFTLLILLNLFAATQDIATDGLAVRLLPSRWRGLGNSVQVVGYKAGFILTSSLLLIAVGQFGWLTSFQGLALLLVVLSIPALMFNENREAPPLRAHDAHLSPLKLVITTYQNLLRIRGMGMWFGVVLTYKVADSLGSAMIKPMLIDQGLSLTEVGSLGFVAALLGLAGAVLGGLLYYRLGARASLIGFGVAQALGLGLFALIPIGVDGLVAIYAISIVEQMADGMSTVALFALMMAHCRPDHEGADYTVQASLQIMVAGAASVLSGFLATWFGYSVLFGLAAALGLLALLPVIYYFRHYNAAPQKV